MKDEGKQSVLAKKRIESGSDDDSGQHERHGGEGTKERFAAKVEFGEKDGGGETETKSEDCGEDGLVEGEE